MAKETANDTQVAEENEAPNDEAVQADELVQAEDMAQADELIQGEEINQGNDPSDWNQTEEKEVSKIAGTSHLKRHITLGSCPKIKNQEQRLALPSAGGTDNDGEGTVERRTKRRYRYTGYANAAFDQDRSCSYLAKMIIQHDYPLHIVQQPAFGTFIESLQPRFKIVDVDTMEGEVYAVYQKEKENLLQAFNSMPVRISLTIGLWTTSQTLGYVSLAGQFIDTEWKVHRRMLSFMMVSSPHSENALSEAISMTLSDWNMKDKLFTITLDNECSSHDIYSANLRDYLSNKNNLMLKGQLFVVRCYAHILNAAAQDVMASIHGVIYNIRESTGGATLGP
ncbi:zinc finger BED domain-containing protein RICESLEEPER 2-like [Panicum virgatum]|uniref:zinc finger BED domain-containing protein RICESLEEPER 2-like n=1 Tax=Panicum virgatum TaxID=38727 RepID=UPI0019D51AD2|nr:zinc finger BED domain-containing protein RICESLEEPER 2-like [Panicum virgatum]